VSNLVAFVDPAGGGGSDSMTLAWAHASGKRVVLDGVVEKRPPFSPQACAEEFCETLKRLGISSVTGDRFSGEWVRESFRERGIGYLISERTKSEIYRQFLVLANSGLVSIPLHRRLVAQLKQLERRVLRGGRESIDHVSGAHDDVANAVAGALMLASVGAGREPWAEVISFPANGATPSEGSYVSSRPEDVTDIKNDYGFGGSHHVASFGRPR
jgi:hypothetical protein